MLTQVKAQEAFEVLKSWLKWSLWLWGWMTSARLILFVFFLPELHQKEAFDIAWAFFQGARFDLAVIGILWSPFWILLSIWPFFSSFKKGLRILKGYWLIGVFVLFNLHWLDFFWFKYKNQHLDHVKNIIELGEGLSQAWDQVGLVADLVATFLFLGLTLFLVSLLFKIELRKTYQTPSSLKTFIRWALSGLIVFTAARGSLINRALSIQDANFSDDPLLNQLPLNAPWNMDM